MIRYRIRIPTLIISRDERRFIIRGLSERSKVLVVAHTDDGELVRIISAREATYAERKSYEEG